MPGKNQKALTISLKAFNLAKGRAEAKGKSVAGHVIDLIVKDSEPVEVAKN